MTSRQRSVLFLPFFNDPEFHAGIARYAGQHGWHLNAEMARTGKVPHGWRGDGIIMSLTNDHAANRIAREARIPIVDYTYYRPDLPVARVTKDNPAIGQLAARHFIEQGWHTLAYFSREDQNVSHLRLEGFRGELARQGLVCHELIWPGARRRLPNTWEALRDWLVRELVKLPRPLAILAYNDYDAAIVMDACLGAGLKVPDDIGVLGVDDSAIVCPCQPVPLSSIQSDPDMVSYRAAELLDRLMNGEAPPPESVLIPPRGVAQRQSTDRLVIRDLRLARAIALIGRGLEQSFSMEHVAEAAGISRKMLYQLFARELHQTPVQFLLRRRLGLASRLLADTTEREYTIAKRCGMPVMSTFIRQFQREFGMKPRDWRSQHKGDSG